MARFASPSNRPCPNPAYPPVLDQARAYVRTKLGGVFLPSYAELGQSAAYQTLRQEIAQALAAGDLDATKAACRTWCKLVIQWTRDHPVPMAPVVPVSTDPQPSCPTCGETFLMRNAEGWYCPLHPKVTLAIANNSEEHAA
jgi:hypothetical protein